MLNIKGGKKMTHEKIFLWKITNLVAFGIILIHNLRFLHLYISGILPWQEKILNQEWFSIDSILIRLLILFVSFLLIFKYSSLKITTFLMWLFCCLILYHEVEKYLFIFTSIMVLLGFYRLFEGDN